MIPGMPRNSEPSTPDETPAQKVPMEPDEVAAAGTPFADPPAPTEVESPAVSDGGLPPSDESTGAASAASESAPVDNLASDGGVSAEAGIDPADAPASAVPIPADAGDSPPENYPTVEEQFLSGDIVAPESSVSVSDDPGASSVPEPAFEYDEALVPEWDPIGVVVPGQTGGASHLVVRLLGRGDSGVYGNTEALIVADRQEAAGLPRTGIVSGLTWALLLPSPFGPHGGAVRGALRQVLGVGGFNERVEGALLNVAPSDGLRGWAEQNEVPEGAEPIWVYLLGLAVHAYFEREREKNASNQSGGTWEDAPSEPPPAPDVDPATIEG